MNMTIFSLSELTNFNVIYMLTYFLYLYFSLLNVSHVSTLFNIFLLFNYSGSTYCTVLNNDNFHYHKSISAERSKSHMKVLHGLWNTETAADNPTQIIWTTKSWTQAILWWKWQSRGKTTVHMKNNAHTRSLLLTKQGNSFIHIVFYIYF